MVVCRRLRVVWNAVLKTGPGTDNKIVAGISYKTASAAELMAALQAFLLLLMHSPSQKETMRDSQEKA